jgi:hypothetical protein
VFEWTNEECSEAKVSAAESFGAVCIVVFARVFFFFLERALFRACVESSAKINSASAALNKRIAGVRRSISSIHTTPSSEQLKLGRLAESRAYATETLQADPKHWDFSCFSDECDVPVHWYAADRQNCCMWKKVSGGSDPKDPSWHLPTPS